MTTYKVDEEKLKALTSSEHINAVKNLYTYYDSADNYITELCRRIRRLKSILNLA